MKRVIVTGASGFVGRHVLAPLAARGFEVHAVGSDRINAGENDATWHRLDLHEADATRALLRKVRPTHLLHLAWHVPPGNYLASPENLRWTRATLALLEAFAAEGGRRFVGAGTCFEYDLGEPSPFRERVTPLRPATLYGVCKDASRRIAEAAAPVLGVSFAWGRIFYVYGPHEPHGRLVPSVATALLDGRPAECTSGEHGRDYLHVADVADAFAAIAGSGVEGAVNVGAGEAVEIRRIAGTLARLAGRPDLLRLGARPTPPSDPPVIEADVGRLRNELNWRPRIALDEGLAGTLAWWAEQRKGVP